MKRAVAAVLLLALTACGDDEPAPHAVEVPEWAKVAPEQIAEAKKHGVPVAFENHLGMRFVLIPAGTFLMGSPEDEEGRGWDEMQHHVTISRPYYMQITEVTNGQYRLLREGHASGDFRGHTLDGDTQPAVQVSWYEATSFARSLSERGGRRSYRLPTEAEWEQTCRAGTTTSYSFGDSEADLVQYANFSDRNDPIHAARPHLDDGRSVSASASGYKANPWGIFDMHGNAWEWCADWWAAYSEDGTCDPAGPQVPETHTPASQPTGRRVIRGGSWGLAPSLLRSAQRLRTTPDFKNGDLGFRLVSPLPEPSK